MRRLGWLMGFICVFWQGVCGAAWTEISQTLNETDIYRLAVHPRQPGLILAASQKRVFLSKDQGRQWKQLLGVRSSDRINAVYIDPADPTVFYAGAGRDLKRSLDGGKHWKTLFTVPSETGSAVTAVASHAAYPNRLYVGTSQGLYIVDAKSAQAFRASDIPAVAIDAVVCAATDPAAVWAAGEKGVYETNDRGLHWKLRFAETRKENAPSTELGQFQIEELSHAAAFSDIALTSAGDKLYAATREGLFEGTFKEGSWQKAAGQNLPDKKINALISTPRTMYAATDQGVFEWQPGENRFAEVYEGLSSKEIRALAYDRAGDAVYAATKQGVFRLSYPEMQKPAQFIPVPPSYRWDEISRSFAAEPDIRTVHQWAVEYAEVHPDKIRHWREAAARKAWLPTLSVGSGLSSDQNIDLDRGGTNDPDRFIKGPNEKSVDMNVDVRWDLSELVWNADQTSIDTRSRLMVELRQDVLNEVTHLYFERRRLKAQMLMNPDTDPAIGIERQIRLQELNAGIDALTGGRFTTALPQN